MTIMLYCFGKTTGFIIEIRDTVPENYPADPAKIRPIKRIVDKEPLFGEELISMAKWLSHYYLCTFGEAVFSMIPSGMYLLTSLALTIGVIALAKRRMLVQELYCIEMLARVDVICFDKTGTLTEDKMNVAELISTLAPSNTFS